MLELNESKWKIKTKQLGKEKKSDANLLLIIMLKN